MKFCCTALLLAVLAAPPEKGQEGPKATNEGKKALEQLVQLCVDSGGLKRIKLPGGKGEQLEVTDAAKLAAAVKAAPAFPTRSLCDALVVAWGTAEVAGKTVFAELLRRVGEKTGDKRTRAFALLVKAKGDEGMRAYRAALQGFLAAAELFSATGEPDWQAICLNQIGLAYDALGEPVKALDYKRQALVILHRLITGTHPFVAASLNNVGLSYAALGEPAKALDYFRQALEMRQKLYPGPHTLVAQSLNSVGGAYGQLGDAAKALDYQSRALAMRQQLFKGAHPDLASSLDNVGQDYAALGKLTQALDYARRGLAMNQQLYASPHPNIAHSLNSVGYCYDQLGESAKALDCYLRALEMRQRLFPTPHPVLAHSLSNVGSAYDTLGELDQALTYCRRALAMNQQLFPGPHPDIATALENVGAVYGSLGESAQALDYQRRALAMRRQLDPGPHPYVATTLSNLGVNYLKLGEPAQALNYVLRALAMKQQLFTGPHPSVATALNNVGAAYSDLGEPLRALEYLRRALAMEQQLFPGPHPSVATSLNNIGFVHKDLGDLERALDYFSRALAMRRQLYPGPHPEVAQDLNNVGYVLDRLGRTAQALEPYELALHQLRSASHTPDSDWLVASKLRPMPQTMVLLGNRCICLRRLLPPTPTAAQLRACAQAYAEAAAMLDRLRGEVHQRDASKLRAGESGAYITPERVGLLARLFTLERNPSHLHTAFVAAEQGRARVFLESLGRAHGTRLAGVPSDLARRESDLLHRLGELRARIGREESETDKRMADRLETLWREYEAAEAGQRLLAEELRQAAPRYAALRYPKPCTVTEARAALSPGEVALVYVLGREGSYLLVMEQAPSRDDSTGGLAVYPLPATDALAEKVAALTARGTLELEGEARERGRELYRLLLGPAAGRLVGKPLVIVPDGELCYLPFQLLVEDDGRYLVEGHRVRYAASLTALHLGRLWAADRQKRALPDRAVYALGDPDYGPSSPTRSEAVAALGQLERGDPAEEEFPRLVNSGREVEAVASLFGKEYCRILTRTQATEAAVKAASAKGELASYRYLHFACHGVLGRDGGQQPGLVLSLAAADGKDDGAGGVNDGFLRQDEVLGLRLNADLVVLSACRSGRGRLYAGEGVVGLARAFQYAGTRAVACSLWAVDDEATAGLMHGFYARLKEGQSPADALCEAQRAMIRAGQPLLYWAPFILIGE
jgi:CHAT domain-containing protein/Tfp pilus assembly protein PilF